MDIKRIGSQPSGKGPADHFTGVVRMDPLVSAAEPARVAGTRVTFEPGARTAWHTHPLGQTLIVTEGCGWAQRAGGPIEEIHPGDVIWFEPGEKHWHGATPTTAMTHIAIQEKSTAPPSTGWSMSATNNIADDMAMLRASLKPAGSAGHFLQMFDRVGHRNDVCVFLVKVEQIERMRCFMAVENAFLYDLDAVSVRGCIDHRGAHDSARRLAADDQGVDAVKRHRRPATASPRKRWVPFSSTPLHPGIGFTSSTISAERRLRARASSSIGAELRPSLSRCAASFSPASPNCSAW